MALVDSLLSAIVRADGDALVMHVGERPYVVVGTLTINISTHALTLDAMTGMLAQLLNGEALSQLEEFGAVEHRIPQEGSDRFTCVAARGGDDIWIEIRRRRAHAAAAVEAPAAPAHEPAPEPQAAQPEPVMGVAEASVEPIPVEEPVAAPIAMQPVAEPEMPSEIYGAPQAVIEPVLEAPPVEMLAPEPIQIPEPEPVVEFVATVPEPEPVPFAEPTVEPAAAALPEPIVEEVAEPIAAPVVEEAAEPIAASVVEEVEEPSAPPLAEQVAEPIVEQAAPAPEPVVESVLEPAAAAMPEPIAETVAEPIAEPVAAPIPEPVMEPALEPAAEVTLTPTADPIAAPILEPTTESIEPLPLPAAASIEPETRTDQRVAQPMSRTVRIEVSPRTAAAVRATSIERLLRLGASRGASDVFLTPGSRPWIRIEGALRQLDGESPLSRAAVEGAILEIAPESAQALIAKGESAEWTTEFADVGRVRCTTFVDQRGPGVLLRLIATRAATVEQLGLTREVQALATESQGIVLVVAPRGSGKSTLLSALVDLVNRQRAEFVITLERQLRLMHDSKAAFVSQREVRGGDDDAIGAARSALRENPDVLVVDDLVSSPMVPLLTTAAADGMLVFVTITAASTTDAVQRFIELAPPEARQSVQSAMAESFRGAVAQVLLKKTAGGSIAAREVMLATATVSRAIGDGQLTQLPQALEGGRKHGMVSVNDALMDFVRTGTVDVREAFRKAPDRARLLDSLKRDGVDTSAVERLA